LFLRDAVALQIDGTERVVTMSDGGAVRARTIVVATGVDYRRLGIPTLELLVGRGVFYGATVSEAPAMVGKPVYVVGGGNSAGQAAVHLAKFASEVTLLVRGSSLSESMSDYLIHELHSTRNIAVVYRAAVVDGRAVDGQLAQIDISHLDDGTIET